jgi:hypothetical protein
VNGKHREVAGRHVAHVPEGELMDVAFGVACANREVADVRATDGGAVDAEKCAGGCLHVDEVGEHVVYVVCAATVNDQGEDALSSVDGEIGAVRGEETVARRDVEGLVVVLLTAVGV